MSGVTTFAQNPNHASTSAVHHSPASDIREMSRRERNMIMLGLLLEFAFLATLAAYELSSILRTQN